MMKPAGLEARRAALKLLDAVLRRGETLEAARPAALRALSSSADRALALAIANESLRWLTDLDALIDSAMARPLPGDAKARSVLRLMLAQSLRLDIAPHAVIATGLPLLSGGPRRLAHGVFSTLMKRGARLPEFPSLPEAVVRRWGFERSARIARALAEPPPLDLTLRDQSETESWARRLGAVSLAPGHLRLARGTRVEAIEGFTRGAWWVQDLAASIPARVLGPGQGRRALDLCAAPGGKTLQLAAAGWRVSALDRSEHRLEWLRDNLARTGLEAEIHCADALEWPGEQSFDAVLLDAPCTATGTCRRHPDVLHRIGEAEIAAMAQLQRALIERARRWLKPDGRLVYAVCSLEREEGEAQAEAVDLEPLPIAAERLPTGIVPDKPGFVRTDPSMLAKHGGIDGFFVAQFRA